MAGNKDQDIRKLFERALSDAQAPPGLDQRIAAISSQEQQSPVTAQRWPLPLSALAAGILLGALGMQMFASQPKFIQQLAAPEFLLRAGDSKVIEQIELAGLSRERYLRLVTELVSVGRYDDARRVLDAFDHYFPSQPLAGD